MQKFMEQFYFSMSTKEVTPIVEFNFNGDDQLFCTDFLVYESIFFHII